MKSDAVSKLGLQVHTGWSRLDPPKNDSGWMGEVVVEADSWKGPYHLISSRDITDCVRCEEDPFMWQDFRGNWHALYQ